MKAFLGVVVLMKNRQEIYVHKFIRAHSSKDEAEKNGVQDVLRTHPRSRGWSVIQSHASEVPSDRLRDVLDRCKKE